jgi:hypothetical protein
MALPSFDLACNGGRGGIATTNIHRGIVSLRRQAFDPFALFAYGRVGFVARATKTGKVIAVAGSANKKAEHKGA